MVRTDRPAPDRFLVLHDGAYSALLDTAQEVRGLMRFRFEEGLVESVEGPAALERLHALLQGDPTLVVRLIVDRLDSTLRDRLFAELSAESCARVHVHEFGVAPAMAVDSLSAPERKVINAWIQAGASTAPQIDGDPAFCVRYAHAFDKWLADMVDQDLLDDVLDLKLDEADEQAAHAPRPIGAAVPYKLTHTVASRPRASNADDFALHDASLPLAARSHHSHSDAQMLGRPWPLVEGAPIPMVVQAIELHDEAEMGRIHVVLTVQGPLPFWAPARLRFLRRGGTAVAECSNWFHDRPELAQGVAGVYLARAELSDPGGDVRSDLLQAVDRVELQFSRLPASSVAHSTRTGTADTERLAAAGGDPLGETLQWEATAPFATLRVRARLPVEAGQRDPVIVTVQVTGADVPRDLVLQWLDEVDCPVGIAPTTVTLQAQGDAPASASVALRDDDDLLVDRLHRAVRVVPLLPGEQLSPA